MVGDFLQGTLGKTGMPVCRLGLSASYWPGKRAIHRAIDEGVNYLFAYGFDRQMIRVFHDVARGTGRSQFVLTTGAYNLLVGHPNLRRTLEKRLRQFRTDYIDAFLFLGVMKPSQFPDTVVEELHRFREEGKVRAVGLSTHQRLFAAKLIRDGAIDVAMIRYNAAHRGAETELFPDLEPHDPGVVSYTATRWRFLLRRPRGWPRHGRVPTPGDCYRFVLSNPHVDVCLMAPSSVRQCKDNLSAVRTGPLSEDDMSFMRQFGDVVHGGKRWFM
jgi:aryl-alcohol dehydrogenase-like predicted oxidoreductase